MQRRPNLLPAVQDRNRPHKLRLLSNHLPTTKQSQTISDYTVIPAATHLLVGCGMWGQFEPRRRHRSWWCNRSQRNGQAFTFIRHIIWSVPIPKPKLGNGNADPSDRSGHNRDNLETTQLQHQFEVLPLRASFLKSRNLAVEKHLETLDQKTYVTWASMWGFPNYATAYPPPWKLLRKRCTIRYKLIGL